MLTIQLALQDARNQVGLQEACDPQGQLHITQLPCSYAHRVLNSPPCAHSNGLGGYTHAQFRSAGTGGEKKRNGRYAYSVTIRASCMTHSWSAHTDSVQP